MNNETVIDIVGDIREFAALIGLGGQKLLSNGLSEIADRLEAAYERELIVAKSKAAAEGYAAGKDDSYEN